MQTFEADKILDESYNAKGIKIYLIKWVGHDISEATWEPHSIFVKIDVPIALKRLILKVLSKKGVSNKSILEVLK
jgi:hypothetical protein